MGNGITMPAVVIFATKKYTILLNLCSSRMASLKIDFDGENFNAKKYKINYVKSYKTLFRHKLGVYRNLLVLTN